MYRCPECDSEADTLVYDPIVYDPVCQECYDRYLKEFEETDRREGFGGQR